MSKRVMPTRKEYSKRALAPQSGATAGRVGGGGWGEAVATDISEQPRNTRQKNGAFRSGIRRTPGERRRREASREVYRDGNERSKKTTYLPVRLGLWAFVLRLQGLAALDPLLHLFLRIVDAPMEACGQSRRAPEARKRVRSATIQW